MLWRIGYALAALVLVRQWKAQDSVWWAAGIGVFVGLCIALVRGFDWAIVANSAAFTLGAFVLDLAVDFVGNRKPRG